MKNDVLPAHVQEFLKATEKSKSVAQPSPQNAQDVLNAAGQTAFTPDTLEA